MYNYESLKALAARLGRPVASLLALAPQNDPFYADMPSRKRDAERLADLWNRFRFHNAHIRRIHYTFVSQDPKIVTPRGSVYENTDDCWKYLVSASGSARHLRFVPPAAFVDNMTEAPMDAIVPSESPAAVSVSEASTLYDLDVDDLSNLPRQVLIPPVIRQRYRVEIWVEKSTISDILKPLHDEYRVTAMTGVGEISTTRCQEFVDRVARDGRPCRILYVSDFDPKGRQMPVSVARKIEHRLYTDSLDLNIQVRPVLRVIG
jgi:hypothetical protein